MFSQAATGASLLYSQMLHNEQHLWFDQITQFSSAGTFRCPGCMRKVDAINLSPVPPTLHHHASGHMRFN